AELAGIRQAIGSDEPDSPVEESDADIEVEAPTSGLRVILGILGIVLILFSAGAALFTAQWMLNPNGFQKVRDRFFQERLQLPPTTPPNSQQ
ncbi:MAG TPA: serine/threonine-protein phosphatase, partial [Cyanophyceae cyanobacterium]